MACHLHTYSMTLCYTQMINFGNNFFCSDVQCLFCVIYLSKKFFIIRHAISITHLNMVAIHCTFTKKSLTKIYPNFEHIKKATNKDTERTTENEKILCRNQRIFLIFSNVYFINILTRPWTFGYVS